LAGIGQKYTSEVDGATVGHVAPAFVTRR